MKTAPSRDITSPALGAPGQAGASTSSQLRGRLGAPVIRAFSWSGSAISLATLLLFAISPLLAPGSLNSVSLLSMLPFAAVLAIIAVGQTLVIAQRGLDLSVPGMVSLGAVLATKLPSDDGTVWIGILAALVFPAIAGLVSGMIITTFGVPPLVATLGMNAALIGMVLGISSGIPTGAQGGFNRFLLEKSIGIPNTVLITLVIVIVIGYLSRRTIAGHRLTALGVNTESSRAIGIRVSFYTAAAYTMAGACFGIAGALLAGYIQTPNIFIGEQYLLPSVAAVVLGGTALTGGRAGVVGSAIAALFLTQLGQLLLSIGWPSSAQLIAQAAVLVTVVLLHGLTGRFRRARRAAPS